MLATLQMLRQDETHAEFRILDENGAELYRCHRDVTREMRLAKRRHESLAATILQAERKFPSLPRLRVK